MSIICGVDVSKAWLDAWAAKKYQRFANTPEGVEALFAFTQEHGVELLVMEASGGVEQAAFLALWKLGQPCTIANPRAVRSFADAMGFLEKTDRIDAEMIAGYAAAKGTDCYTAAVRKPASIDRACHQIAASLGRSVGPKAAPPLHE